MTTTKTRTIRAALDDASLGELSSLLTLMKLGTILSPIKVVAQGLTAAASHDITTAAFKALATITGITLDTGENLPALGGCLSLRCTANTGGTHVGTYILTDVAGVMLTPATSTACGVARISDDGKTITFPGADITAFILEYMPRADTSPDTAYQSPAP